MKICKWLEMYVVDVSTHISNVKYFEYGLYIFMIYILIILNISFTYHVNNLKYLYVNNYECDVNMHIV